MNKHTPGPWRVEFNFVGDFPTKARVCIFAKPKSDEHTATNVGEAEFSADPSGFHVDNRETAEANARLMAAAPDLLAVARHVQMLRRLGGMLPGVREMLDEVIADADAAIAKVEGRAP